MITPSFSATATERVLPKLALDFTTASLDARVTFTRTTSASNPATYVNSSGYIASAANDTPRFDYDPVTLACKGLLIEESRTNLYTYSADFRDTATAGSTRQWSYVNSSIVIDQTTAPDNTLSADLLLPSAGLNSHRLGVSVTMTGSVTYTQTLYAKPAGYSRIALYWVGLGYYTTFDVSTGQVLYTSGGISSTISSAGNGWYKITNTYTQAATPGAGVRLYVVSPTDVTIANFNADGTSGIYIWGAQLEAGAFATSYIPTNGSSLTRNADVATMTGTNFSDWYNAVKGTFRVDAISRASGTRPIIAADDNSADNNLIIKTENTTPTFVATQGGSEQVSVVAGTIAANADMYVYVSYDSNYFGIARNTSRQVDTTGTVPTVDRLRIGASQAGAYLNSIIKKIQFWN